jgi:glycosyltransferase involved in cell wall biosynthesis
MVLAALFPPQKKGGGPTVSIMNLLNTIKGSVTIYVISHNHEVGEQAPLPGIEEKEYERDFGKVFYFNHGNDSYKNLYMKLEDFAPDTIYVNSFFSWNYTLSALVYSKKHRNVKVIIAPRGELCTNAYGLKKFKKSAYVAFCQMSGLMGGVCWHATAEEEKVDIRKIMKVDEKSINVIPNISIIPQRIFDTVEKHSGDLKLVFVSRIQVKKNLLFTLKLLRGQKCSVSLDIYGPLEDKEYWNECEKIIDKLPENIRVQYCGILRQSQIHTTLKKYHAFVLTTLSENYGHAIVEALLSYRPVIISDQTPWTDVNEAHAGFAGNLSEPEKFCETLTRLVEMDQEEFNNLCMRAGDYIDQKIDNKKIEESYRSMFWR